MIIYSPNPTFVPSLSEIGDLSCITSCPVLPGFLMDTLLKQFHMWMYRRSFNLNCRERCLSQLCTQLTYYCENNAWEKFRLERDWNPQPLQNWCKWKCLSQFCDNVLLNVNMRRKDSVLSFTPDDGHRSQNQGVSMFRPACQISKL